MKMKTVIVVFFLLVAAVGFSSHRETIGQDEVGVRQQLGATSVFQGGEVAFIVPFVSQFVKMTTKPVTFTMAGVGAISISGEEEGQRISFDGKVRYQIEDAGRFIQDVGMTDPATKLEDRMRGKITDVFRQRHLEGGFDLTSVPNRLLLSAELLHDLNNESFTPGVKVLSFELLNW